MESARADASRLMGRQFAGPIHDGSEQFGIIHDLAQLDGLSCQALPAHMRKTRKRTPKNSRARVVSQQPYRNEKSRWRRLPCCCNAQNLPLGGSENPCKQDKIVQDLCWLQLKQGEIGALCDGGVEVACGLEEPID